MNIAVAGKRLFRCAVAWRFLRLADVFDEFVQCFTVFFLGYFSYGIHI